MADNKVMKPKKENRKSKDLNKDSDYKLELANSIKKNSKQVINTYAQIENSIVYLIRWLSGFIDRFLFNKKLSKFSTLILAIVFYIAINADGSSTGILASSAGTKLDAIPVQVIVNSEVYEIDGIPSSVSAAVIGDVSDIQLLKSQSSYKVTADLSGLTEGTHQVSLTPTDFSNRLTVNLNPSTVMVTIKKKTTQKFKISHEYINTNRMENIYALDGAPSLESTEVVVRASQDTIDNIAYVKALIDVSGVTQDFVTTAQIVAYDQSGQKLNVDIVPETVQASVQVTTPQKEVPINVIPIGELPDGLSIDSITLDHSTVTVYASQTILNELDEIRVEVDATKIDKNSSWTYAINVPSGVNSLSVTKINIDVKVGETVTRTIDNIPVSYRNNVNGYRLDWGTNSMYQSVVIKGTQNNVDMLTAEDIKIFLELEGIEPGMNQDIPLTVEGSSKMVTYSLASGMETMSITVVKS
ncbi:MAG: hypothetical protein HUJ58_00240 [Erysipelotrichaceae bacterium]|nr:hypothetical protein [Erysipelotrichaceae bacterium]